MAARLTKLLVLAALALVVTASGGSAASPTRARILGVVPHNGPAAPPATHALPRAKAIFPAGPTPLTFDANYQTLINRYFTDVAHDSGGTQNVYSVATQYYDNPGTIHIQYQSTFGGSYVAHDPLPANGCDDHADAYCLTDQQLENEIQTAMAAKGWQGGLAHMFFLLTPNGVGSCFDGSSQECSTNIFCAYHSAFGTSISNAIVYANEPYLGPSQGCSDPTTQGFPNNDVDAETTINTISHEHNEAITDPLGNAWIANDGLGGTPGDENGDLCAYGFGTQLGGTDGVDAYNQVINGHHYELQQEYSNQDSGCIQHTGDLNHTPETFGTGPLLYNFHNDPVAPVMHTNTTYAIYWLPAAGSQTPPVVTGTAHVNQTLTTTTGTWNGGATAFHDQWQRCSPAGTSCANIAGATASSYKLTSADGGHTVRATVVATNVNGPSTPAASAATAVVIDVPGATKLPHVSGRARVGKKLSGTHGAWTYSPTSYRFQWLRCNGHGARCSTIRRATHSTYKLAKHDAGHRLRLRITATNAVGSSVAVSTASARVPTPKKR